MLNKNKISKDFNSKGYTILKNYLTLRERENFKKQIINLYNKKLDKKINEKNLDKIITNYEKNGRYDELYKVFLEITKMSSFSKVSKRLKKLTKLIFDKKSKSITNGITIGIKNHNRTSYEWHQEKPYYKKISTLHFQFPIFRACNKSNGTMSVLSKSHKYGYINDVRNKILGKKHINSYIPKKINYYKKNHKERFINMNLGDMVIFHENLIHKSNKNNTNRIRFAGIVRLKLY